MTPPESHSLSGMVGALHAVSEAGALVLVGPGPSLQFPPGVAHRTVPEGMLIPLAEGARLASAGRPVVAIGGDGDVYGEGLGNLLHAVRRNTGVLCLVLENGIAAGGIAGVGPGEYPLRPLALAMTAGASFVAQAVPESDLGHLTAEALQHNGFALINIRQDFQPERVYSVDGRAEYDEFNRKAALQFIAGTDRLATGILFRDPDRDAFEDVVRMQWGDGSAEAEEDHRWG